MRTHLTTDGITTPEFGRTNKRGRTRILGMKPWQFILLIAILPSIWVVGVMISNTWQTWLGVTEESTIQEGVGIETPVAPEGVAEQDLVKVTRPLDFYAKDPLAGGAVTSATIGLYSLDGVQEESLTSDSSDGTIATSGSYTSGDQFYVKVSKSSYITAWYELTVPYMAPGDAESLSVNPVTVYVYDYDAWSITVRDNLGNTYSDGGSINATSGQNPGTNTFTLYMDVIQTTDNSGYVNSYDPVDDENYYLMLVLKIDNTNYELISLTGCQDFFEKGSAVYCTFKVNPDGVNGVSRWVKGNTVEWEGSQTISVEWDLSGYTGDAADLDIDLYRYADSALFQSKGTWGRSKADGISATLDFDIGAA